MVIYKSRNKKIKQTEEKMKKLLLLTILSFAVISSGNCVTLSFSAITSNNVNSVISGESQLFVDVVSYNANQVLFTFKNIGSNACSITDIYFDNGSPSKTLSSVAFLIDADENGGDAGVDFSIGAAPPELPSANNISPAFSTTPSFLMDSDSPISSKGVNPGESFGVVFNLLSGKNFQNVLNSLANRELRIGIHAQSFSQGTSESFVNIPPKSVPEPATIGLLTASLIGFTGFKRRR